MTWWIAIAALLTVASPAAASLGGTADTVDADRVSMRGALLRIAQTDAYAVHEIQSATGTVVREFVSPAGTVFAVAWQGPAVPNMRQVLGTYFDQFQAALRDRSGRTRRGPVSIETPGLVVQMSGHQRALTGRVFVPQLVPAGVDTAAIR